jgi:peroxiredoxin
MKNGSMWKVMMVGVGCAFLLALAPAPALDVVAVGSQAPDFTLEDQNGNRVSLSDFSGKVVVLEWINWDCPFVQRHYETGTMAKLSEKFKDQDVVWLAINSTHYAEKSADKEWITKHSLSYPILSDSSGEVGKMYGAKTTPHMYIIDKSGKLVYAGGIDDDPRGESEKPTNYVKHAIKDVLAGNPVTTPESKPYGCSVKYKQ